MSNFITNGELRMEAERLCDENERLQAENAKLREQITRFQANWESERDYADQMEAKEKRAVSENDKLREFATLAWQVLTRNEPLYVWQGMVDDARELGIEAD